MTSKQQSRLSAVSAAYLLGHWYPNDVAAGAAALTVIVLGLVSLVDLIRAWRREP